ncbi:hypothetical protein XENTR_v10004965 [Xenopus tropicalis]|nr:hypothetical protein XENTR_v10004965 [Xenopus tropicalis]
MLKKLNLFCHHCGVRMSELSGTIWQQKLAFPVAAKMFMNPKKYLPWVSFCQKKCFFCSGKKSKKTITANSLLEFFHGFCSLPKNTKNRKSRFLPIDSTAKACKKLQNGDISPKFCHFRDFSTVSLILRAF